MTKRNQPTDPPTAAAGQICDYIHATTKQCANTHRPYDDRSHDEILSRSPFYPRDAMLARVLVMTLCPCLSVCVCVCQKSVFYRNSWMNRAGFWRGSFLPPILHCVKRKFGYLQKWGYFPLELCPKLRTLNILLRRIDRRNVLSVWTYGPNLALEKGGDVHSVLNWTVVSQLSWQCHRAPTLNC